MEEKGKYAVLGNHPEHGQSKKAWVLKIDEFKKIDPKDYFITTGEALVKTEVLLNDLRDLTKDIKKLQREMVKTKADSDYLETCWEDGKLLLKKKEKRSRNVKSESDTESK